MWGPSSKFRAIRWVVGVCSKVQAELEAFKSPVVLVPDNSQACMQDGWDSQSRSVSQAVKIPEAEEFEGDGNHWTYLGEKPLGAAVDSSTVPLSHLLGDFEGLFKTRTPQVHSRSPATLLQELAGTECSTCVVVHLPSTLSSMTFSAEALSPCHR